jgi:hypothetical protein
MIPSVIEPATFRLVVQCLNQLRLHVPQSRDRKPNKIPLTRHRRNRVDKIYTIYPKQLAPISIVLQTSCCLERHAAVLCNIQHCNISFVKTDKKSNWQIDLPPSDAPLTIEPSPTSAYLTHNTKVATVLRIRPTIINLLALADWLRYTYVTRTDIISKLYSY